MPRRFFKKFAFKRHHIAKQWFMTPFRHLLHDHRLWGIRRRWVVPAFAIGLFIAFMPFSGHTLAAALLALALRVNIPVAAVSTWVSNPADHVPACTTSRIAWVRPCSAGNCSRSPSKCRWDWVTHTFVNIWQPMLLGSVLSGAAAAVVGYVTLDFLWRLSLANYKDTQTQARRDKTQADSLQDAVLEHQDAIHSLGNRMIVRHDHEAGLHLLIQLEHQLQHMFAVAGIQIARRLIGEYQLRSRDQRPCNRGALAFAARQFAGFVCQALAQADAAQADSRALQTRPPWALAESAAASRRFPRP